MALFKRDVRKTILPATAGSLLAEYGEYEFGTGSTPSVETTTLLVLLQGQQAQERSSEVVREMRDLATAAGGWAVYGASSLILSFLPQEAQSASAQEVFDEKIVFLRSLSLPNLRGYLGTEEQSRWRSLYPGDWQ